MTTRPIRITIFELDEKGKRMKTFYGQLLMKGEKADDGNAPELIIVEGADMVEEFRQATGGELSKKDTDEILMGVCQALLCSESVEINGKVAEWVDFNAMRSASLIRSHDYRLQVEEAMRQLARRLLARLQSLGAYKDGDFPYFFDSLLPTGDLLLHRLP